MTEVTALDLEKKTITFGAAKPTVGRIVHFHEEGGPYPAIITAVNDNGTLELATFGKNSLYFQHSVSAGGPDASVPSKGCWTWPPRG